MLMGRNWGNGRTREKLQKIPTLPSTTDPLATPGFELGTPVETDDRLTALLKNC